VGFEAIFFYPSCESGKPQKSILRLINEWLALPKRFHLILLLMGDKRIKIHRTPGFRSYSIKYLSVLFVDFPLIHVLFYRQRCLDLLIHSTKSWLGCIVDEIIFLDTKISLDRLSRLCANFSAPGPKNNHRDFRRWVCTIKFEGFNVSKWLFARLSHIKCMRLGSVRSIHPF